MPNNPTVTFLSAPISLVQASDVPTFPNNQQEVTTASIPSSPTTKPSLFDGLQLTFSPYDHPFRGLPQGPPAYNSSISDVRFLLSRPNHFVFRTTFDNLSPDRQRYRKF